MARSYDTVGHPRPIGWPPGRANDSWLIICFWQADGKTTMAAIRRELKTHGPNYTMHPRISEREREREKERKREREREIINDRRKQINKWYRL